MSHIKCFGVDAGYGWLKLVGANEKIRISSMVGTARERNITPDKTVLLDDLHVRITGEGFNNEEFFVGDLAKNESLDAGATLDIERIDISRVLILTILAATCEDNPSVKIWLTTGLPISHYQAQKDKLIQKLSGHFEVEFRAGRLKDKRVIIDTSRVNVIPQAAGAVFSQVFDPEGVAYSNEVSSQRIACIDIGYKTTDFITLDKLSYIDQLSSSLPIGVVDAHKAIMKRLSEQGRELLLSDLEDYSPDVPEFQYVAQKISKNIRPYINEDTPILLAGGGALAMGKYIRGKIIPSAQFANAEGFYRMTLAWRRKAYGSGV